METFGEELNGRGWEVDLIKIHYMQAFNFQMIKINHYYLLGHNMLK